MVRLTTRFSRVFTVTGVAAFLFAFSCTQSAPSIPPVEKLFPSVAITQPESGANKVVNFNLDGTLSMRGFAAPKDGKFAQLLQELDLSLSANSTRSQIHYHRFGSRIEDVPRQPFYVAASAESFYQNTKDYAATRIDTVFRQSQPDNLTLVMTDLFEKDLDIGSIEEALKTAAFPARSSLAIWQWSLPFSGQIYDFDFRTSQGHSYAGSRFLYLMALGSEASIGNLRQAIDRTVTIGKPQFLLLSGKLLTDSQNWLTVAQTSSAALVRRSPGDAQSAPYLVYRTSRNCSVAGFTAVPHLTPTPDGVFAPASPSRSGAYQAELFSVAGKNGSWETHSLSRPIVNTAVPKAPPNAIKIELDCAAIQSSNLALLRLQRVGTPEDIVLPDWVKNSSANAAQFNAGYQGKLPTWGGKTLNLAPLIQGLANTAADGATAATAYFYFLKS